MSAQKTQKNEQRPKGKKGAKKVSKPKPSTSKRWGKWGLDFLLATLAGCMVFLSFPDYDYFPLQWFSLIPLLAVLKGKAPKAAFGWGLWTGTVTNCGGFYWITSMLMDFGHFSLAVAIPICILLCAYQGLVFAFWAAFSSWLSEGFTARVLWVVPLVWVVVEYCIPLIFPWYFANGQYLFYAVIQICEITGVMGLSFLIVLFNTGLYLGIINGSQKGFTARWRPALVVIVLFLANLLYGVVRIGQVDALSEQSEKLKIGMVEANVGIFEKQARGVGDRSKRYDLLQGNVLKHHLLSKELEEKHQVDLIVEPESSFISAWPRAFVRFKRNDLFGVTAGHGRNLWLNNGGSWNGPERLAGKNTVIRGLSAAREDQVFAVGDQGLVLRLKKGEWVSLKSPTESNLLSVWSGAANPRMTAMDGSALNTFVVGEDGSSFVHHPTTGWKTLNTQTRSHLRAVMGSHSNRVYTVGDGGVILRWNGKGWYAQKSNTTYNLHSLWVTPSGVATAVGQSGVLLTLSGSKWRGTRLGNQDLNGVAAFGKNRVAVGNGGVIWEGRNGQWNRVTSPTTKNLHDVSADGWGNFFAVGDAGTVVVRSRDGQTWTMAPPLQPAESLRAVAGIPFTTSHAFARESRYAFVSKAPLPEVNDRIQAAGNIEPAFELDRHTSGMDWNTPLRDTTTPLLLGLLSYERSDPEGDPLASKRSRKNYNSAMLIEPDGRIVDRYDKTFLLMFGEFIPFGDVFPQFYEWLPQASHFYPGTSVKTFAFRGHKLGVMICYEDILPSFSRKLAGQDPHVLINVTNDAWFGKTSEPYLHLALAVFRTVESRLWLVRSTNTGVSAFVDAVGRIVSQTDLDNPEVLVADVPMLRTSTFYRSYGELFTYACFLVFAVLVIGVLSRRRKKRVAQA
ncbi:MAG TPA: apolipoprotein N-acyltransferase [Myxococcales bacterium]|nr:apolipoprotein N-acyltransferase [Myxococcales bacterium]